MAWAKGFRPGYRLVQSREDARHPSNNSSQFGGRKARSSLVASPPGSTRPGPMMRFSAPILPGTRRNQGGDDSDDLDDRGSTTHHRPAGVLALTRAGPGGTGSLSRHP